LHPGTNLQEAPHFRGLIEKNQGAKLKKLKV
jgi:hypothetical protein